MGTGRPSGLPLQHRPAPPARPPIYGTLWVVGPGERAGVASQLRMQLAPPTNYALPVSLANNAGSIPSAFHAARQRSSAGVLNSTS